MRIALHGGVPTQRHCPGGPQIHAGRSNPSNPFTQARGRRPSRLPDRAVAAPAPGPTGARCGQGAGAWPAPAAGVAPPARGARGGARSRALVARAVVATTTRRAGAGTGKRNTGARSAQDAINEQCRNCTSTMCLNVSLGSLIAMQNCQNDRRKAIALPSKHYPLAPLGV